MPDLNAALRDADPLGREPRLSAADAAAIRRTVVAAADHAEDASAASWPRPLAMAATMAAMLLVGIAGGAGWPWSVARDPAPRAALAHEPSPAGAAVRRQLQFATPGGTRIIWVFDPEFNP